MKKQTKRQVYKQLIEPLYKSTINEPVELILKDIVALCTQLRLEQRNISIIGINKGFK